MRWRKSISPGLALRDVRLLRPSNGEREIAEAACREREKVAYERGLTEGEKRLSEQLLKQRADLLALQNGVLNSLRNSVQGVLRQSEAAMIELALEVARKLVFALPISTELVEGCVRSALAQAEQGAEIHVYLHAEDLALLQRCNSPVLLAEPGSDGLHFHASPEVTRGGCLLQTRFGIIDTRRETKLELIHQSLGA